MLLSGVMSFRAGRASLLVLISLFAFLSARAEFPNVAGTMPEDYFPELRKLLETARKQAPQTLLKQIEIEQMQARAIQAYAAQLPSLGSDIHYDSSQTSRSTDTSTKTRDNGLFYSFGLSQPVFYWGALKRTTDIAKLHVAITKREYDEMARQLCGIFRQSYLSLVVEKSLLVHGRFSLGLLKDDLASAKERLDAGLISDADYQGRNLIFNERALELDKGEAHFAAGRRSLAQLAGLADLPEASIPAVFPKPVFSPGQAASILAELKGTGARSTFAAQVAEMKVREADLNYQIQRVRQRPKFSASASYSAQNATNVTATEVTQTGIIQQTLQVYAHWQIFDGFATKGAKQEALAQKRSAERQLQTVSETTIEQVQTLQTIVELDARTADISDIRESIATQLLGRATEESGLGNLPGTAIDAATRDLRLAEYVSAQNRAAFLTHWSEFVSLAGADPATNTIPARHAR